MFDKLTTAFGSVLIAWAVVEVVRDGTPMLMDWWQKQWQSKAKSPE